jgi:photosystem II stability/assembly factor-like uncharacterized protein
MMYIPRRSLLKTLLMGIILLLVFQAYGLHSAEPDNIFMAQAAIRYPASKLTLQETDDDYAIYIPAAVNLPVPRLTLQEADDDYAIYLPAVIQPPRVELSEIWTADEFRSIREAFLPGKIIRYYAQGYVNIPDAATIGLKWSVDGPCSSKVLYDGTGQIHQGLWTLYQTDVAPNCPGVYTYTLRMTYQDEVTVDSFSFVINHPSEVVSMSLQGFDKCNIPYGSKTESINQMQSWWYLSPYYSTNLYIGGISRYCSNTELDAVWVNQVAKQGWSFIPTWVGPQAPCTSYRYRFSSSPSTAYQQGVLEANAAFETARNLGFLGNTVLYYDLEMYSTTNQSCRDAAKSFLAGWSQRLQEVGVRSGVYGHRVNVNDWASIAYPGTPNNVWIASWIRSYYDPNVSAYGIPGVSDDLWRDQRIRQYAGDHTETYGGFAFSIDSNIMDGEVTVLPNTTSNSSALVPTGEIEESKAQILNILSDTYNEVQDMQLISNNRGWAIVDQRILWTNDGGDTWSDITPPSITPESVMAAKFIDESSGWTVLQDILTGEVKVYTTANSGVEWRVSSMIDGDAFIGPLVSAVYLDLLDGQTGWVAVRMMSSANFKTGRLFYTRDGGGSWEERTLPFGERVKFMDAERGWIAGGPAGNQLFYTQDGGRTWQEQDIQSSFPREIEDILAGLPELGDGQNASIQTATIDTDLPEGVVKMEIKPDGQGWAQVNRTNCSGTKLPLQSDPFQGLSGLRCEKISSILRTLDGGETWVDITP